MAQTVLDDETALDGEIWSRLAERTVRHAPRSETSPCRRIVRIGLLGFGNVGRAVARSLQSARQLLLADGLELRLTTALVRDARRPRSDAPPGLLLTADPAVFLVRRHDLVIELLGGVQPALGLVRQCLEAGIDVVTANKSLLAAHGEALWAIARRHGAGLRGEASALAGVPFLNNLRRRPLAARVTRVTGIFNGTTNYIFSRLSADGLSLSEALAEAQRLGFAEPDASFDLSGRDAAEKLVVILQHLGITGISTSTFEVQGVESIRASDFTAARLMGGALKPIAHATIEESHVAALVGPAWLPQSSPLARLEREENGIQLGGSGGLFFSGPGAGPDVTARTILDDVVETLSGDIVGFERPARRIRIIRPPLTGWFIRVSFTARRLSYPAAIDFLAERGITTRRFVGVRPERDGSLLYAITRPCDRPQLEDALAALRQQETCETTAFRALEESCINSFAK